MSAAAVEQVVVPYPDFDGSQPCTRIEPELFFPRGYLKPAPPAARAACAACPFMRPCLGFALTHLVEGVWGGTTDKERDELRARHGIRPVAMTFTAGPSLAQRAGRLLAAGLSDAEIAAELDITQHYLRSNLLTDRTRK